MVKTETLIWATGKNDDGKWAIGIW